MPASVPVAALLACGVAASVAGWAAAGTTSAARPKGAAFAIRGTLPRPLRPGSWESVDLALRNRRRSTIWITRLTVRLRIDRRHRAAGCSARRDFVVGQLPAQVYPIRLPGKAKGRGWRRLDALGVRARPWVQMRNLLAVNQDACKGASLRLKYTARARNRWVRPR